MSIEAVPAVIPQQVGPDIDTQDAQNISRNPLRRLIMAGAALLASTAVINETAYASDGVGQDAAISTCANGENPADYISTGQKVPCKRPGDTLCQPYDPNVRYGIQDPNAPYDIYGRQVTKVFWYCGTTPLAPAQTPPPKGELVIPPITSVGTASKFVAISPERIFNTRDGTGENGVAKPIAANSSVDIDIRNQPGISKDATAVVVNLTAIGQAAGYVTAYPTGTPRPNVSALNINNPGDIVPNLVTVPIGANGDITVYSQSGTELVVDAEGSYVPAASGSAAGRLIAGLTPGRVYDSRDANAQMHLGETRTLDVTGVAGIPKTGVGAVELNMTAVDAQASGFITVWPDGIARPDTSVVNFASGANSIAANRVLVPVTNGKIDIYASQDISIVIDAVDAFTDNSAVVSTSGLFQAVTPTRLLDTRYDQNRPQAMQGYLVDISKAGLDPSKFIGMEGNLTITGLNNQMTFGTAYTEVNNGRSTVNGMLTRANGFAALLRTSVAVNRPSDMIVDVSGLYSK
ncbi:MAG: hypothetical protein JWO47_842 [Candidatus Saccharibacteria bacterium]|nr:hypothetical protein [Candidatus Saccharibacteria bacterium]